MISVLPDHIANQIAAGEVIQRPASVVKELMENSIDAHSTTIQVHIKKAGKTLIQIVDNGKGMNSKDAELCFLRHATSKIKSADDLFSLTTKGFRGEALASIAAISHVNMQTREANTDTGTRIVIEGGEIVAKEETACSEGTSFEVKNLFYNVPARRNFLKSDEIEFRHIKEEFERIVLAHPSINFILTHNETIVYHLRESVLRKRIVGILGERQDDRLVPIEEHTDIVSIRGYVVKPQYSKKTRGEQFFFVNQRFFKDSYFHHAVNKAFENLVQPKTFPGYFIYFDIDPSKIDVNVHPTKTEIKFAENQFVYSILVSAIRQSLGKYNIAPSIDFDREPSFDLPIEVYSKPIVEPQIKVRENYNPFKNDSSGFGKTNHSREEWENFYEIHNAVPTNTTNSLLLSSSEDQQSFDIRNSLNSFDQFIVWSPYLFFPIPTGVMIIHGHRAYERVVYDSMIEEFILRPIVSQPLLFPYEVELSDAEQHCWRVNNLLLERLGFVAEIKNNTLFLNTVPSILQEEVIGKCIDSILKNITFENIDQGDIAHVLVAGIAQNAGRLKKISDNKENIQYLINTLFQSSEHLYTPSGKLIIKTLHISSKQPLF